MLLDVRCNDRRFGGKADLRDLRLWGQTPFPGLVEIGGSISHRHGRTDVDYTAAYTICGTCARCLAEVCREKSSGFCHQVSENLDDSERDDVIYAPGGMLDMTQLAGEDLLLLLSHQPLLCKEGCKGLCPQCGGDLNAAKCGCPEQKEVDPRFAALLDLIDTDHE